MPITLVPSFEVNTYPNPFVRETTIEFDLHISTQVYISIFNSIGQEIKVVHSGKLKSGLNKVTWDGKSEDGSLVNSGTYFYKIQLEEGNIETGVILKF